jgi:hypothetical protein
VLNPAEIQPGRIFEGRIFGDEESAVRRQVVEVRGSEVGVLVYPNGSRPWVLRLADFARWADREWLPPSRQRSISPGG